MCPKAQVRTGKCPKCPKCEKELKCTPCSVERGLKKTTLGGKSILPLIELQQKNAKYVPTKLTCDLSQLNEQDRKALVPLLKAARIMDLLFWKQASPDGYAIKKLIEQSSDLARKILLRYVTINYGRFDRLARNEPFIGRDRKPLGANYYPKDMTKKEFEDHLKLNPNQANNFKHTFTMIRRKNGKLTAIPYSKFFRKELVKAAKYLREAAALVSNASLRKFLKSRADAFLSNNYYQSDCDWVDVKDSPIDVTIGPYEVYEDELFGYKGAFTSFLTIRDAAGSARLQALASHLSSLEKELPLAAEHKAYKRPQTSPIMVVCELHTAGDTLAGSQTIAFNLPNDEKVRKVKGSKKVMLANVTRAKFDKILTRIAGRLVGAGQVTNVTWKAFFNQILMHELAHGMGPGEIKVNGKNMTVRHALKEHYSTIEEAKADVLGLFNLIKLVDKGVLPKALRKEAYITFLAGHFRSVRFGISSAHGRANIMQFNFISERGGYVYNPTKFKYTVDLEKINGILADLARKLLTIEAEGNYNQARAFISKYGKMPTSLKPLLASINDIPVDVEPRYITAKMLLK